MSESELTEEQQSLLTAEQEAYEGAIRKAEIAYLTNRVAELVVENDRLHELLAADETMNLEGEQHGDHDSSDRMANSAGR